MTFPKLSEFIYSSKTFPGLEFAILKFYDFSRFFMNVRTLNVQHLTVTVGDSSYWGVNVFSVQRYDSDEVFLSSQLAWQHC